jgi:predicted DNA-binding transcriptional regulator YafY
MFMFNNGYKQNIIDAIQKKLFLNIKYRDKEGGIKEKKVAPYDLFSKSGKDFLLGCSKEYLQNMEGFSKYIDDIEQIVITNESFLGEEVRRTLDYPSRQPNIQRNW